MSIRSKIEKTRAKSYTLDLRIHSPASVGYQTIQGIETADALVRLCKVKGIDVIAITDSNSGVYIDRVVESAKNQPLIVLPGVEIRCRLDECDDVNLACIFREGSGSELVERFLSRLQIPSSARGRNDFVVKENLESIIKLVEEFEGAMIPCRMDKTPQRMRVIPSLVEDFGFRTFELAYADTAKFFKKRWPKLKFNLISFSEAKALAQVGSRTAKAKLTKPGIEGIREFTKREELVPLT
jgi:DNA polymerase III alpha subunit